ncbi:ABC transporter permease [uncultured Roseibium sp.]|uniref:ABC transporter permease n=1 Tax=uncultured Roseibium sp. TaxID=1936171 RepID=UPI0026336EB8|nr:ABC transporter permease [uncultured Roseibium sp.]
MYSKSLGASLKRQFAIISALIIREMTTRYGTKFGGYMWAVLDPVLFIGILTLVFSAIARLPPLGRSFVLFYATGYLAFYSYRSTADQIAKSIEANKALLNYPVVTPYDTIISRIILQLITLFAVNMLLFTCINLFSPIGSIDLEPVIIASILAISLGSGVGAANAVWFHMNTTYEHVWGIINRPAFMVSGVFFLPEEIPHPYREFLMWNPMIHVVGLFRTGFYPTYRAAYVDLTYVVGIAIFSVVFGFVLVWMFDARIREPK